jgi:hypothetical protein
MCTRDAMEAPHDSRKVQCAEVCQGRVVPRRDHEVRRSTWTSTARSTGPCSAPSGTPVHTRRATCAHDDDPPEAAYVVPGDFGMSVVSIAYCPAFGDNWTTLQPGGSVCVGPSPVGSGEAPSDVPHDASSPSGHKEGLFPCRETLRRLLPVPDRSNCPVSFVGWCTTDGRQAACCPPDLVARAHASARPAA